MPIHWLSELMVMLLERKKTQIMANIKIEVNSKLEHRSILARISATTAIKKTIIPKIISSYKISCSLGNFYSYDF